VRRTLASLPVMRRGDDYELRVDDRVFTYYVMTPGGQLNAIITPRMKRPSGGSPPASSLS
jgi:hypothetical protein